MVFLNNFFFGDVSYFFWLGTIYLIVMSIQDFRKKGFVDDRFNFLMMGSAFSLVSHVNRPFWYFLFLFFVVLILGFFLRKYSLVGDGDIKCLGWVIYGYGIVGSFGLLWFFLVFSVLTIIYFFVKKLFRLSIGTPFFVVILFSFIVVNLIFGYYF